MGGSAAPLGLQLKLKLYIMMSSMAVRLCTPGPRHLLAFGSACMYLPQSSFTVPAPRILSQLLAT